MPNPTTVASRTVGLLHLRFHRSAQENEGAGWGPTRLQPLAQQPPLRVVRAFPLDDGAVLTHLHNVSGGVLGGDQLTLRVAVEAGAQVQLTSTGATRVYRHRPAFAAASQVNSFTVAGGGLLEYLPDSLIPFAGARFQQQTRIELAEDAGLFYWEVIAPGREAHNELFAYDELALHLDITATGQPIVRERLRLQPALRPLTSTARMGAYRYFGTFYICRVGVPAAQWLALESELMALAQRLTQPGSVLWGVSTMPAHGLTVRTLSLTNRAISDGLLQFWQQAKLALYGRSAIPPRKVY